MNKIVFIVAICLMMGILSAQIQVNNSEQLPSIIIKAKGTDTSNFSLQNTVANTGIPVTDLSRQFVKPGTYSLSYEKWGYHKYKSSFDIGVNDEKIIDFIPVPVSRELLNNYYVSSKVGVISLITSAATLACAALCKEMGDSEYDKYRNSIDSDDIKKYRSNSEVYEIAFYSSSTVCLTAAVSWLCTRSSKKTAKARIINEMNKLAP